MLRLIAALGLATVLLPSAGCSIDGFCINCAEDDGGTGDGDGGGTGDGGDVIDAGPPGDACVTTGIEICDGLDNDCNGTADDGDLAGTGDACSTDEGECVAGTTACVDGDIVCQGGVFPVTETCNGLDDDCDGEDDNGIPVVSCGTDTGECVAGTLQCVDGGMDCVGELDLTGSDEDCDGLDNDCDGDYDEDVMGAPIGDACGPTQGDEGECSAGTIQCIGGVPQCMGAVYPVLEKCDGDPDTVDWDCDGSFTNGFSLTTDVRNCGACGNTCLDDHTAGDHVAAQFCDAGTCAISQCEDDYWNNNAGTGAPGYDDGCEYFCDTFSGPVEACNGDDDDCDGDVDPPAELTHPEVCPGGPGTCRDVCDIAGTLCAGTISECVAGAWTCNWPAGVDNADGDTLPDPESDCDDVDNDCDGVADDLFPAKGDPCNDGGVGVCRRTGELVCNGAENGLECGNLSPPVSPTTETCNGLDDDCLGDIDEGFTDGANAAWVDIGGGVDIFAYEASRPDADDSTAGTMDTHVCSKPDAIPWTNITYEEAAAECAGIGARLCTEAEWQRACQGLGSRYVSDGSANNVFSMQAEDYHANTLGSSGGDWGPLAMTGYSGVTAMFSNHDGTARNPDATSPRMDYDLTVSTAGTYYIWMRVMLTGDAGNSAHAGADGTASANTFCNLTTYNTWLWCSVINNSATRATVTMTAGDHTFNVWMREDDMFIDKIVLTTNINYDPALITSNPAGIGPKAGCAWSYGTDCETYAANTCNGNDFDTDTPTPTGDQDRVLPTESMASCFTDWGAAGKIYDLSGNVKEFADDRSDGVNPVRGGASNNSSSGISCGNDFTAVDDDFAFPNTGFRCCRD
jgi:hypothetical protein